MPAKRPLLERFWEKVNKDGPLLIETRCWQWMSADNGEGYSQIWVGNGRQRYAHRLSYEIHKGEIPKGMVLMHSCDNPRCVNPDHLIPGTALDNVRDKLAKGRQPMGKGWLKPELKSAIIAALKRGILQTEIAAGLRVSIRTVRRLSAELRRSNEVFN